MKKEVLKSTFLMAMTLSSALQANADDVTFTSSNLPIVIIQTDQAESTYGSHCTITDVDITIKSQCRVIEGSFKCNGYNISFTASYH